MRNVLRCGTALLSMALLLASSQVLPKAAEPDVALPEISVQAPEPRYVAPTRRDHIGRIWAPVLINGQGPFRLVLDTGATRSAVTSRVATELALPQTIDGVLLRGVTGSATVPTIHAESLEVGDLITRGAALPIVQDAFGGAEGVLGSEGLGGMRIRIEFNADRITISRSHGQPAADDFIAIPMKFLSGRVPAISANVGGVRVRAIIDTGAQTTTANLALRDALLRRRPRSELQPRQIEGVTLDVQNGDSITVPVIELGGIELRDAHVTCVDLDILAPWRMLQEPTLVVGMDVLGLLDTLIIDYKRQELQLRLKNGGVGT